MVAANAARQLGNGAEGGPCRVFSSDLAVELDAAGRYCYPDATIVCGMVERSEHGPAATAPTGVIEVLSKRTAAYDRGGKADAYRRVPSLQAIVFIESEHVGMNALVRDGDRWVVQDADEAGRLVLDVVGAALTTAGVYAGLDLADAAASPREERWG